MRVKCIDNNHQPTLTIGKLYNVVEKTVSCYVLDDDMGITDSFFKYRFAVISEEPKSIVLFNPYDMINEFHQSMIDRGIVVKNVNIQTDYVKVSKDCVTGVVVIEPVQNT